MYLGVPLASERPSVPFMIPYVFAKLMAYDAKSIYNEWLGAKTERSSNLSFQMLIRRLSSNATAQYVIQGACVHRKTETLGELSSCDAFSWECESFAANNSALRQSVTQQCICSDLKLPRESRAPRNVLSVRCPFMPASSILPEPCYG